MKKKLKHLKQFNQNESSNTSTLKINENDGFGEVNIQIDGSGPIKQRIIDDIRRPLSNYQGGRHLFVDGVEVSPYIDSGMGHGINYR